MCKVLGRNLLIILWGSNARETHPIFFHHLLKGVHNGARLYVVDLHRIAAFFRDESCGQCVPCRVGTVRQEELLHRLSRRLVLEFLASSVDLSLAPAVAAYLQRYGAHPERFGPPAPGADRDARHPGHHEEPAGQNAATVAQPVKIDNELYIRDYSRCILCYKCVEACGVDAQNTFAIAVAGRGFEARISTEFAVPLPDSACVYCGNCIGVCPTGALMFRSEYEMRQAGDWHEAEQRHTDTICPYCGVGCPLTLHVQDNRIVKVTSPLDHEVGHGHLCIKGRFGWQFVQNRREEETS